MIRVIPFAVIGAGFLLLQLSRHEMLDKDLQKLFFFLGFLMLPATMGSCIMIADADGYTDMVSLCTGLLIVFGAIWTLMLLLFIYEYLTKKLDGL